MTGYCIGPSYRPDIIDKIVVAGWTAMERMSFADFNASSGHCWQPEWYLAVVAVVQPPCNGVVTEFRISE